MSDDSGYDGLFYYHFTALYKGARFLEAVHGQNLYGPELIFSGSAVDLIGMRGI